MDYFGRAAQILDNLIAQGKAEPMIVVMPNGHAAMEAAPGESSLGYYKPYHMKNGTMDGAFETYFPEIVKFVEVITVCRQTRHTVPLQAFQWVAFILPIFL